MGRGGQEKLPSVEGALSILNSVFVQVLELSFLSGYGGCFVTRVESRHGCKKIDWFFRRFVFLPSEEYIGQEGVTGEHYFVSIFYSLSMDVFSTFIAQKWFIAVGKWSIYRCFD